MGSLITAAVPRLRSPEEANLRAPEAVVSLHVSFINAGAELIETNSFGANRRKLAHHFLEDEFERINSTAVKLAREAREISGRDVFIAGAIGPLGESATSRVREELYSEQASVLEGRGADLFMIETFYDLEELVDAISAVRAVSTLADRRADDVRRRRRDARRRACARSGGAAERARRRGDRRQPRQRPAGRARSARADGQRRVAARSAPEHRPREPLRRSRHLPARGAGVLRRVRRARAQARRARDRRLLRDDARPRSRRSAPRSRRRASHGRSSSSPSASSSWRSARSSARPPSPARSASSEFVVSVQLDPPLGGSALGLLEVARELSEGGVRFVDVNDNATARAGMSSLMVSARIERETGLETVPHLTTRDWTVLGLESMLLGAHAEGVRNVLAITGDPPEVGDYPGSRGVYELDAIGLDAADHAPEPRRGLQRPPDRRPDVVLRRCRRQPDGRRSRGGGRPVPAQGRGGREVRDDADRVRARRARPFRASCSAAGRCPCWPGSSR